MILLILFGIILLTCVSKWIYEAWRDKKEADELDLHNDDWMFEEER